MRKFNLLFFMFLFVCLAPFSSYACEDTQCSNDAITFCEDGSMKVLVSHEQIWITPSGIFAYVDSFTAPFVVESLSTTENGKLEVLIDSIQARMAVGNCTLHKPIHNIAGCRGCMVLYCPMKCRCFS
ncbi:hypothetical protein SCG7109_AB_00360 [Chlamydiales bacterium SCGC AG-110-M15]|nr:hypothetical protein SCG7109_AB_00360 [Chlamydiales bacterium SCGC AG-110-M15]